MTYHPPPSSMPPAPPYYPPPGGPLGYGPPPGWGPSPPSPARRAAIMMWILGGLGLLFGLCLGAAVFVVPMDAVVRQARNTISPAQLAQLGNVDLETFFKALYAAMAGVLIAVSIVLLVLGFFVRRGGRASIITALVIFIGMGLFAVVSILVETAQALTRSPALILGAAFWLLLAAAFGLTVSWLVQALRAGGAAQQMQAYYAHLQQQSFPAQFGYGYGYGMPNQGPASPQQQLGSAPPPPGTTGSSEHSNGSGQQ